jgi:hypothetical protein
VHCCLECRLVQPPTRDCVECGASTVGPMEGLRELMSYRDMKLVAERDMWMISALLAGGSIVMPFLLPFSIVTLGAAGLQARRQRRARNEQPIAAIADVRLAVAPGAIVARGTVHSLRAPVRCAWDGVSCVAAELGVRWVGGLFLRATAVAPFVVAAPDGDIVVDGVVRMVPPMIVYRAARRPETTGAHPMLAALGVPASWHLAGILHVDLVAQGATVTVTGPVAHEPVPALATYRDGGIARVMRGTTSAPVMLEPAAS